MTIPIHSLVTLYLIDSLFFQHDKNFQRAAVGEHVFHIEGDTAGVERERGEKRKKKNEWKSTFNFYQYHCWETATLRPKRKNKF